MVVQLVQQSAFSTGSSRSNSTRVHYSIFPPFNNSAGERASETVTGCQICERRQARSGLREGSVMAEFRYLSSLASTLKPEVVDLQDKAVQACLFRSRFCAYDQPIKAVDVVSDILKQISVSFI